MRKKDTEVSAPLRLASERSEAEIAAERKRQDAEQAAEALNDAPAISPPTCCASSLAPAKSTL
jgi:hypothetical protein